MSLEADARRGELARSVLDNPVYAESYDLIERSIVEAWKESRDAAERDELHRLHKTLAKAKNLIESVMRTGEVAQAELKHKRSIADRVRAFAA